MFQIYFYFSAVIFCIALSVGLICGYTQSSPDITDEGFYWLVGKITAYVIIGILLLILSVITIMEKRGYKIRITKELIENHNHEEEK